jgi:hypothetical protein
MGFMDQIGGLLNQYMNEGGPYSREEAHDHYDQIHQAVPTDLLGSIIGPALNSLGGEEVEKRIYNSATEMNPAQRGGFLETLLNAYRSSGANIPHLLGNLGINQNVAYQPEQVSPTEVAKLATHAQRTNPNIFQQAMSFYAQHPTLVKVLGSMAIASIAKQLGQAQQGRAANPWQ